MEDALDAFVNAGLTLGAHAVTAVYGGNSSYQGSSNTATALTQTVVTTTTVSSSPNPATFGTPVTFTATVTPGGGSNFQQGLVASYYQLNVVPATVSDAFLIPSGFPTANATLLSTRMETQVNVPNNNSGFVPGTPVSGLGTTNVAVKWSGFVTIVAAGTYTFYNPSDDGCFVYVDGTLVASNDGVHSIQDGTSTPIALTAGQHSFLGLYQQGIGPAGVRIEYKGPDTGNTRLLIPATTFAARSRCQPV